MLGTISFDINITASTASWYSAIIATLAFIFSAYNILRDHAKIAISLDTDREIVGHAFPYDPNETYGCITVTNKGRRTVKIAKVSIRILGQSKKFFLLSDSFLINVNRNLNEENPTTQYLFKQNDEELKRMWFIEIYDAIGNSYRKYLHTFPTFWRLYQLIRYRR